MTRVYWQWIKCEMRSDGIPVIHIRMASLDGEAVESTMTLGEAKLLHEVLGAKIAKAIGGAS